MLTIIEKPKTAYCVYLKDGKILRIQARHYCRSFDALSWDFYQDEPRPKILPICSIKAALVDYILLEGSTDELLIEESDNE